MLLSFTTYRQNSDDFNNPDVDNLKLQWTNKYILFSREAGYKLGVFHGWFHLY